MPGISRAANLVVVSADAWIDRGRVALGGSLDAAVWAVLILDRLLADHRAVVQCIWV